MEEMPKKIHTYGNYEKFMELIVVMNTEVK